MSIPLWAAPGKVGIGSRFAELPTRSRTRLEVVSGKGKVIKRYKNQDAKTPLECVALLHEKDLVTFKAGTTLDDLLTKARHKTDLQAAQEMQKAKSQLFELINTPKRKQRA